MRKRKKNKNKAKFYKFPFYCRKAEEKRRAERTEKNATQKLYNIIFKRNKRDEELFLLVVVKRIFIIPAHVSDEKLKIITIKKTCLSPQERLSITMGM